MELIPVLDVRGGRAVHAWGGDRARYRPVRSALVEGCDPRAVARAFRARLGLERLYVADLDAIASGGKALRRAAALVRDLSREGSRVWVDAGAAFPAQVASLLEAGASRVVVGLETLPDPSGLSRLTAEIDAASLAFSLDLRGDRPVTCAPALAVLAPERIALVAVESGFTTLIALDLGRVGSRRGPALTRLGRLPQLAPGARWVAGGGARSVADLRALEAQGYGACLVGTALHEGAIGREDVARLRRQPDRASVLSASR